MLEVDLEYPKHLHKSHNDYPFAPEKLTVKEELLSESQTELLVNKSMINIPKLVPNLMDKNKYAVHYKNLMLYLSLGMKLKESTVFWSLTKNHGWNHTSVSIQKCAKKPSPHLKKTFTN